MALSILKKVLALVFPPSRLGAPANATVIESAISSVLDAPDEEATIPQLPPSGAAIVASIGIYTGPRQFVRRGSFAHFPNTFLGVWYGSLAQLFLRTILSSQRVAYFMASTDNDFQYGKRELTACATPSSDSSASSQSLLSPLNSPNKNPSVTCGYFLEADTVLYPNSLVEPFFEPGRLFHKDDVSPELDCDAAASPTFCNGGHDACYHDFSCSYNDSSSEDDAHNRLLSLTHGGIAYTIPYGYLGRGSFGHVVYAHTSTGKDVAIKIMNKPKLLKRHDPKRVTKILKNELEILKMISNSEVDCPFVMKLIRSWQDEDNVYFVMDIYPEDLRTRLIRREGVALPLTQIKLYAAELLLAITHLHTFQTLHRDLKPSNILISATGHICLADFGFAYTFPSKKMKFAARRVLQEVVGTPEYYAPELLRGHNAEYGCKGEVWDYGLIILDMFIATGEPYFSQFANQEQAISDAAIDIDAFVFDDAARDLLHKILQPKPVCRPDFGKIRQHSFFNDLNWDMVRNLQYTPEYKPQFTGPKSTGLYGSSYETTTDPFEALDLAFESPSNCLVDLELHGVSDLNTVSSDTGIMI